MYICVQFSRDFVCIGLSLFFKRRIWCARMNLKMYPYLSLRMFIISYSSNISFSSPLICHRQKEIERSKKTRNFIFEWHSLTHQWILIKQRHDELWYSTMIFFLSFLFFSFCSLLLYEVYRLLSKHARTQRHAIYY
jgi:hypothetical protein